MLKDFFKKETWIASKKNEQSQKKNKVMDEKKPLNGNKTPHEPIILEIHSAFNSASDILYDKSMNDLMMADKAEINKDKAERLLKLGFISTREASEMRELNNVINEAREQAEIITYYRKNYPFNKFITEDSVKVICEKYGLILGPIDRFIGFVPEKNLREIESFKIKQNDHIIMRSNSWGETNITAEILNKENYEILLTTGYCFYRDKVFLKEKNIMSIVASQKDFNISGMKAKGYKLTQEVKDPIVLHRVKNGYLILTAWGPEDSDELVVNELN